MIPREVRNGSPREVQITVTTARLTGSGYVDEISGAARPAAAPPGRLIPVIFYVPRAGPWVINVNGDPLVHGSDVGLGQCTAIAIEVRLDEATDWVCDH